MPISAREGENLEVMVEEVKGLVEHERQQDEIEEIA